MWKACLEPLAPPQRLCKDCRHFMTTGRSAVPMRLGKCSKLATANLVDGSVEYHYASTIRDSHCFGNWFEPKRAHLFMTPPVIDQ